MVLRKPNSKIGSGFLVSLNSGDDLLVRDTVSLIATSGPAVNATGSNHVATVNGYISGTTNGITLGDSVSADAGNRLVVGAHGIISTPLSGLVTAAVVAGRNASVLNDGRIIGAFALIVGGDGGGTTQVINNGEVIGGLCLGRVNGATDTIRLVNTGRMTGEICYLGGVIFGGNVESRDIVINRGVMSGDILLNDGNDVYDGRKGGRVIGVIDGQGGDDIFRPGKAAENFYGGDQFDTVDFRNSGAVRIALDGVFANTGFADGDTYNGIEQVWGSTTGNDRIRGTSASEILKGFGGADRLIGGDGLNILVGGKGQDILTGGVGTDVFQFTGPGDLGDRITNFDSAGDLLHLSGALFRSSPGQLGPNAGEFRTRADNVAQDGNDHYIFRTTDRTLWWDKDGNGGAGPVLLADLQQSATLTVSDIVYVLA
jgi:Ca2+-binding RTX toxin-like protein